MNAWRLTWPGVLDAIADQILKELGELCLVRQNRREWIMRDGCGTLLYGCLTGEYCLFQSLIAIHILQVQLKPMSEVGVIEEVLNEQLHSLDAANHELHEFRALIVLLIPVSPCQQFRIVCDGSQRFLQVVAD